MHAWLGFTALRRVRPRDSSLLWQELGSLSGAVRLVQLVFLLRFTAFEGGLLSLPVLEVASVVVGEAGALQRTCSYAGPTHSGLWCQGGVWLVVLELVVVS